MGKKAFYLDFVENNSDEVVDLVLISCVYFLPLVPYEYLEGSGSPNGSCPVLLLGIYFLHVLYLLFRNNWFQRI